MRKQQTKKKGRKIIAIFTTLNEIHEHSPCTSGWAKLLKSLDKTHADDEPLALERILDSNGLDDALWALRVVKGQDKELRLFACQCARLVLPIFEERYPGDARPRKAIEAAEAFAKGQIGKAELEKVYAYADAYADAYVYAATDATYVARAAACAAACAYAATDATYVARAAYFAADATTRLEIEKLFLRMCLG